MTPTPRQAKAFELYGQGHSLRTVGRRLGCSHQAVKKWMVQFGIDRRPVGPPIDHERDQQVLEGRAQGMTRPEIARATGLTFAGVCSAVRRLTPTERP